MKRSGDAERNAALGALLRRQSRRALDGSGIAAQHHLPWGIIIGDDANVSIGRLFRQSLGILHGQPEHSGHRPFAHRHGFLHGLPPAFQQPRRIGQAECAGRSQRRVLAKGMPRHGRPLLCQHKASFALQDSDNRQADRHESGLGILSQG